MDSTTKAMVLAFGLDHIIVVTDRPRDANSSRYLESTASTRGKPAITAEAGYSGTVETDDVNALVAGCANVMRYLKILPGEAKPVESPVWLTKVDTISSEVDGIFYPLVKRGTYVEAGTKVGYVTDYFGKTISEKSAPAAGVVLYVCGVPSMKKGELMANIGEVGKPE
jgi:predicted deacylase